MEFSRKTYLDRWIERKHNGLVKILTGIHGCGNSYLLLTTFASTNFLVHQTVQCAVPTSFLPI